MSRIRQPGQPQRADFSWVRLRIDDPYLDQNWWLLFGLPSKPTQKPYTRPKKKTPTPPTILRARRGPFRCQPGQVVHDALALARATWPGIPAVSALKGPGGSG